MCEFTGLDLEMTLDTGLNEIIHIAWKMLGHAFNNLNKEFKTKLCIPSEPLMITFAEGAELLQQHGVNQDPTCDISTTNEKLLGQIVKEKYSSDLFVLTHYPKSVRPFYTKSSESNPIYPDSFDIKCFIRHNLPSEFRVLY